MIQKIEHIGIAVKDAQKAEELFNALLNQKPYKKEIVESEMVQTIFYQNGPNKIELLEALSPESAIAKFIEKKGGIEEVMIDTEITHEGSGTYSMDINDIALSGLIPIRVAVTRPDDTVIISKVKTNWNKEELFLVLYECLGDFAHKHNITISG